MKTEIPSFIILEPLQTCVLTVISVVMHFSNPLEQRNYAVVSTVLYALNPVIVNYLGFYLELH
jgi:hypothetical protein